MSCVSLAWRTRSLRRGAGQTATREETMEGPSWTSPARPNMASRWDTTSIYSTAKYTPNTSHASTSLPFPIQRLASIHLSAVTLAMKPAISLANAAHTVTHTYAVHTAEPLYSGHQRNLTADTTVTQLSVLYREVSLI